MFKLGTYLNDTMTVATRYSGLKQDYEGWTLSYRGYEVLVQPFVSEVLDGAILHGFWGIVREEYARDASAAVFVEWTPSMDKAKDADFLAQQIAKVLAMFDDTLKGKIDEAHFLETCHDRRI